MKHELDNAQTAVVLVTSMQKSSSLLHFDRASTRLVPQMYKGEGIAVGGRVVAIMPVQLSSGMAKHVWSAEHQRCSVGQAVLTTQFMDQRSVRKVTLRDNIYFLRTPT